MSRSQTPQPTSRPARHSVDLLTGSRDPTRGEAGRLARALSARGQPAVDTVVADANHPWRGARAELPYTLAFASQHLTATRGGRLPLANAAPGSADPP